MSIRSSDEEGNCLGLSGHLQRIDSLRQLAGGGRFAPFVERDPVAPGGGIQKAPGNGFRVARLHGYEFIGTVSSKALEVILHCGFCITQGWFARYNNSKSHAWNLAQSGVLLQSLLMIRIAAALVTFLGIAACAPAPGPVKRKMVGLLEKFDRWDYNGDGQLSYSELKDAEQIGGFSAAEIIRFYDTSGNGSISLSEAQSGLLRVDEAREVAEELEN